MHYPNDFNKLRKRFVSTPKTLIRTILFDITGAKNMNYLSYGRSNISDDDLYKIDAEYDDMTSMCEELQFLRDTDDSLREELDSLHGLIKGFKDELEGTMTFKFDE